MAHPYVSILVLNYNGREHLAACLDSLAQLDYPLDRREVLLVDNGSTDGSPAWVRDQFPQVNVVELGQNYGFAEGNNRGAAAARGEVVAFLNSDTRADARWLRELVEPLTGADRTLAATASKMLDWEGRAVDFPVYATLLGMPYASREARRYRRPDDYDIPHEILFASGGAMAIRRAVFLEAGGFDSDFFMYHEDVDLGWRLWLQGYRVVYVPTALVYHKLEGSSAGDRTRLYFLNERNALFTVIKNVGDAWIVRLLPLLLLWLVERVGGYMGIDPSVYRPGSATPAPPPLAAVPPGAAAAIAALMDLIREFPRLLEKRAAIQARRVRSDEEIAALLELPRDVFVQMMLGAGLDFRQAAGLLDRFDLGLGEVSLFGRLLRRAQTLGGSGSGEAQRFTDCLLYLADHSSAEAEAEFGPEIVRSLAAEFGVPPGDLPVLARVLAVVGSKILAGIGPNGGGRSRETMITPDGLLAVVRDALWRDVLFYREELAKRTDQVLRMLLENQERLTAELAREAEWAKEREAAHRARGDLEAAVHTQDRELAQWQARAREWETREAAWQAREAGWVVERSSRLSNLAAVEAARDQAEVALRQILRSKRYRLGHTLAVSLWLATHPGYVALRIREEAWQWGRAALPQSAKAWIKRVLLRRPQDAWGKPVIAHRTAEVEAVSASAPAPASPPSAAGRTVWQPSYDLLVFPSIDWYFRFQRPQQLVSQFAENGHRVFFVSITFAGVQTDDEPGALRVAELRPHVHELRLPGPSGLSVYRNRLNSATLEAWTAAFERLSAEEHIVDAVCLVQLPFWRPLAMRLGQRFGWKIVYDCLDRHSGFSTNDVAMLAEEEALVRGSDLVVATSRALYEEHSARNPRCIQISNAADFGHFSVFVGEPPPRLARLRRPVIGYYGAIADWFDTELVGRIARRRPLWSFVLVGSTFTADLRPLQELSNVQLPGEQPYSLLPAYLHSFDVCLIPFKWLPLTEATNPVKFYEYLSAGKPVVSVPLPELLAYAAEGLLYTAEDAERFVEQIERALQDNSPTLVARRMAFAQTHTWEARFRQLREATRALYPKASIIVLTHSNLHLTRLCIESILRNTSWPHYEIIVVDNASSNGTPGYLRNLAARYEHVRYVLNERNEGFARANNQGIAAASGDYLVLLNNDTIVTRGWLTTMVRYLEAHPEVGMIGPATNLAGNEAKIDVEYTTREEMEAFAARYTREHAGHTLEPRMLGFFCVVIRREIIEQVGPLDERFGIGMFEDDDFSLRVRRAGYRLVCTDGAFVHHFHSSTWHRFSPQEYARMFEANREKFEEKWNMRWTPHRYRWQRPR